MKFSPVNIEERKKIDMKAGDTVRVWVKIEEKGKTRLQAFEGLVIARKHGREIGGTFTVRKIASGVGVERIFPLHSPQIDKIEVVRRAKTRRAKLYYIREKTAKQIRRKMKGLREFVPVEYKEVAIKEEETQPEEGVAQENPPKSKEVVDIENEDKNDDTKPEETIEVKQKLDEETDTKK